MMAEKVARSKAVNQNEVLSDEGFSDVDTTKRDFPKLNTLLHNFYEKNARVSLARKIESEQIAYNVAYKIIRKIQTADSRFRANSLVPHGIPYDGLHANDSIDFDLILQLPIGLNNAIHLLRYEHPLFPRIQPIEHGSWDDCMDRNSQCISPKRVIKLLHHYVKRAVNVLRKYIAANAKEKLPTGLESLELEEGFCTVVVRINNKIRVKLLPSFSIPDCRTDLSMKSCPSSTHVVAVPLTNSNPFELVADNGKQEKKHLKVRWKLSFFVAEKNKMRTVADGCRITLLRILTEIRDNEPMLSLLSPYHLKIIFFHEIDAHSRLKEWDDSKVAIRFLSLLRRIYNYLQDGVCPSYFMQPPDFPLINLFDEIGRPDLNSMQEKIHDIIKNPESVLSS